jgi:hypothetical protein
MLTIRLVNKNSTVEMSHRISVNNSNSEYKKYQKVNNTYNKYAINRSSFTDEENN